MKEDPETLLSAYGRSLLRQGFRQRTAKQHASHLRRLFDYLCRQDLSFQEVGYRQAQDYLAWLNRTGRLGDGSRYATKTLVGFVKAAVSFYGFLQSQGRVTANPFAELEPLRVERKVPRTLLKEHQMHRLLSALGDFDTAVGMKALRRRYRVHVIAELQYATGLRIAEVAELREEDIDFRRGVIEVRRGKGGQARIAYLNEYAKEVLEVYVRELRSWVLNERSSGRRVFGAGAATLMRLMRAELERVSRELGFGRLRSHDFRHAFGFHLLRSGCDIRFIQALLGHRLLRSTEVYTRVEKEDLRKVLDRYHPRCWRGKGWEG